MNSDLCKRFFSAHVELIEDKEGNLIDTKNYCSDFCHKQNNKKYEGWNGLNEISFSQKCENQNCFNLIVGVNE
jgi:hypothetical protein